MSYTSENEEDNFFDAYDVTPMHSKTSLLSTDSSRRNRNKDTHLTKEKDNYGDKLCREMSFDSSHSNLTTYETPLKSAESRTKCSVVILEPDIVQSTKSSSLPRQQLPMATVTPRKKKAKSADLPLYSPEDQPTFIKTHCLIPESDGSGSVTPNMPECSSPILDITSATKGSCLVSLCEQVRLERARRCSRESLDSVPSKDLSSTDDPLSTEPILEDVCDDDNENDRRKELNRDVESCSDDKVYNQSDKHHFSPSTFSSPLSAFSSLQVGTSTTTTTTSTTSATNNSISPLHSHGSDDAFNKNLHHSFREQGSSFFSVTTKNNHTCNISPVVATAEEEDDDEDEEDREDVDEDDDDEEEEEEEDRDEDDGMVKSSDDPSDTSILLNTMVVNLDTGETLALSSAEEKLPKCINPLSLHIMRRTKEYSSDSNLHKGEESDNEGSKVGTPQAKKNKLPGKRRTALKQFFGKTVNRFKSVAEKNPHTGETLTDDDDIADPIKVKNSHSHKGPYDFELLVPIQEIGDNKSGAVWTMKFSHCGRLLATGGQDGLLRVWVLQDYLQFFNNMRKKYSDVGRTSDSTDVFSEINAQSQPESQTASEQTETDQSFLPFHKQPFSTYKGHTADVLDISWSKNYFLLSSSMDKTVRLWHVSRWECLCCFQHIDFVTAISFHPKDDRYFLSGSLDGKLRLWNIPDKKVALWNEVVGPAKLITAANFCLNGRFAVVGTYDGRCIFYNSEHLKYFTQIHVRSTRGRNKRGRKITGVEPFPGDNKILVTSNDSRIRLYDLRDLTLTCKFKGVTNNTSQIKGSFSHDGKYVVCGSEDQFIYIWKTQHEFYKFSSARKDRNNYWEGIKAHSAVVTNAIFAPDPEVIIKPQFEFIDPDDKSNSGGGKGEVLVSADYLGSIRIFINKFKPLA